MNWHAVAIVAFIAVAIGNVFGFAVTMSAIDCGAPMREVARYAGAELVLFAAFALLSGVVFA